MIKRVITAVVACWRGQGGSLTATSLRRSVSSEDFKKYANLAKKYVAGMNAQERDTGIAAGDT